MIFAKTDENILKRHQWIFIQPIKKNCRNFSMFQFQRHVKKSSSCRTKVNLVFCNFMTHSSESEVNFSPLLYDRQKTHFPLMNEWNVKSQLTVKFVNCWILMMIFLKEEFRNIFFKVSFDLPNGSSPLLSRIASFWSSIDSFFRFSFTFRLIVKFLSFFRTLFNVFDELFWLLCTSFVALTTTSHVFTISSVFCDILDCKIIFFEAFEEKKLFRRF